MDGYLINMENISTDLFIQWMLKEMGFHICLHQMSSQTISLYVVDQ